MNLIDNQREKQNANDISQFKERLNNSHKKRIGKSRGGPHINPGLEYDEENEIIAVRAEPFQFD